MISNFGLNQINLAALVGTAAVLCMSPANAQRTAYEEAARSVVRIDCVATGGGEKKATGFVWPEPGFVVTALHAVVGCDAIRVHSEATGNLTTAKVERVLKIADLALIRLKDDLELNAVDHQNTRPNASGRFFIYGYPLATIALLGNPIAFGMGIGSELLTLDEAFASDQLNELFDTQEYPTRDTQILRVTTTISPGHSGAPIFSDKGQVVAIADGGLLNGWRGVNWSIPAFVYLPPLLGSKDGIPKSGSQADGLFSQKTAVRTAAVAIGPSASGGFQNLMLVRSLTLDELDATLPSDDFYAELIPAIRDYDSGLASSPGFDIYENSTSGATLGVPAGSQLKWNDEIGIAEAIADRGAVRMYVGALQAGSYQEAKEKAARFFVARASTLADWDERPAEFTYESDYEFEHTGFAGFFDGTDRATGQRYVLQLDIEVNGSNVMGWAVYSPEEPSSDGAIALMMMQLAGEKLSDYALK